MSSNSVIDYCSRLYIGPKILKIIRNNFTMHHGLYDSNHKKHSDAQTNLKHFLAKITRISPYDKILDIGCGIGGSSIWLAKNFGASVIGVDINKERITIAKRLAEENKINDLVSFFVGDFFDSKFFNNSFDIIWCVETLCYIKNKRQFCTEAKRLLKDYGRIIIADGFFKDENRESPIEEELNKFCDRCGISNLLKANELIKYLEESGFKNIEFSDLTENIIPSSKREYMIALFSYPIEKFFKKIGLWRKIYTEASYYTYIALKKRLFGYGVFYAEKK